MVLLICRICCWSSSGYHHIDMHFHFGMRQTTQTLHIISCASSPRYAEHPSCVMQHCPSAFVQLNASVVLPLLPMRGSGILTQHCLPNLAPVCVIFICLCAHGDFAVRHCDTKKRLTCLADYRQQASIYCTACHKCAQASSVPGDYCES